MSSDNNNNNNANQEKVKVHFVAVGSAPILKKAKFQISAHQPFYAVTTFLRKMLKLADGAALFLYIQSAFCPGPEEIIGDVQKSFGVREELVIHYAIQEAWGWVRMVVSHATMNHKDSCM